MRHGAPTEAEEADLFALHLILKAEFGIDEITEEALKPLLKWMRLREAAIVQRRRAKRERARIAVARGKRKPPGEGNWVADMVDQDEQANPIIPPET